MTRKQVIITLAVLGVLAFILRTIPQWSKVFQANNVIFFLEPDATMHSRLWFYQLANNFHFLTFDAYAVYPDGGPAAYRPLLGWLVSIPSWIIGLGHPSTQLVETVAVFIPPILGALLLIPVYFLGKNVFNQRTGIIGCILVALMPTELMNRTRLGFTDNHALEAILTVCIILFMVLSIKKNNSWLAVLAGLFYGLYLWAWHGAVFMSAIIFIYFLIEYFRDPQQAEANHLPGRIVVCLIVAFVVFAPYLPYSIVPIEFLLPILAIAVVAIRTTRKLAYKNRPLFIGMWLGIILIAFLYVWRFQPVIWNMFAADVTSIFWGIGSSILEARPPDMSLILIEYGLITLIAIFGIIMAIKHKSNTLFLVFSFVWLIGMFGQRRWGYYSTVPIALFGGYCIDRVLANTGKRFKVSVAAVITIMISLTLVPGGMTMLKSQPDMTQNWYNALTWMKDNTPDPFGDPNSYFKEIHSKPSYGIIAWWDYGHFLISTGRRVPLSSNTYQTSLPVSRFFAGQTVDESEEAIKGLTVKYVILDGRTPGIFYAMVLMAGKGQDWQPLWINSTANRLYSSDTYGNYHILKVFGDVRIYERNQEVINASN